MTEQELKPCPFCGGEAEPVEPIYTKLGIEKWGNVECCVCGASLIREAGEQAAIAAWNRRVDGWIPVSERLPEENEDVLCTNNKEKWVSMGSIQNGNWFDCREYCAEYACKITVTHWMSKPKPPKGE